MARSLHPPGHFGLCSKGVLGEAVHFERAGGNKRIVVKDKTLKCCCSPGNWLRQSTSQEDPPSRHRFCFSMVAGRGTKAGGATKAQSAGWYFQVYALVQVFRGDCLQITEEKNFWDVKWDRCPSAHKCCLCPLASLPCRNCQLQSIFPMAVKFGGCSPPPIWEM